MSKPRQVRHFATSMPLRDRPRPVLMFSVIRHPTFVSNNGSCLYTGYGHVHLFVNNFHSPKFHFMGRITEGPMGQIRGKVGNMVVGKWRKTTVVRGLNTPSNKPRTQSQLEQQAKMAIAGKFMRTLKLLLPQSFTDHPERMTGFNAAVRYLLKNAIAGDYPNYAIQYNRVLVSRGDLLHEGNATATAGPGQVNFTWTFDPADVLVKANDKAVLVVYCEALNKALFTLGDATRSTGSASLAVTRFKGQEVHSWLAFLSADGKDASNSVYTGKLTIS